MNLHLHYLIIGIVVVVLISGCVQLENIIKSNKEIQSSDEDISTMGLGNLCSSLTDCFVFCKDHVGLCTDFCAKNDGITI